ncbi:MAG: GNAT family N-acetyltransferase, partial [Caloramator sp.]|nr:GNAT family N-acetyltransferase [Caloramator sp.]
MLHISIFHENFIIRNVSIDSLEDIVECINSDESNLEAIGISKKIDLEFIRERYMESLVNPLEFFCGIYKDGDMLGIIKGRMENKCIQEAWFMTFILRYELRNKGLGSHVLKLVEEYLKTFYNVQRYCAI